ncbi:hypothetical protein SOV92_16150 [Pectobacterium brasiliense]|uniref:BHLH domain-containing protein n=1 Tax=Pectobacterium brasiliense TaxID=180957 RepID=A0AAW9HI18_9GAMM|nr:hypothetical protein [Pectobacterium brasiliense]MDY4379335.1 hypothetical protein [Pectobacterium brasiliense]
MASSGKIDFDRRRRDAEYQRVRRNKLKDLGEHSLIIQVSNDDYNKLADLCEALSYPRPEEKKRNLVEIYSKVFSYLINQIDKEIIKQDKGAISNKPSTRAVYKERLSPLNLDNKVRRVNKITPLA